VSASRRLGLVPGLAGALAVDLAEPGAAGHLRDAGPFEAVVHAAAAVVHDPNDISVSLANCAGTQRVLSLAEEWGVPFAYISGVPVIGLPTRLPIDEDHPTDPPTAYHASKLYGEHLVELARRRRLPAVSLRLSSPVGPGMPAGRILSVFVAAALAGEPLEVAGEGSRAQDYVDVRDAARAVAACLEQGVDGLYNVAAGRCFTNLELARQCIEQLESSAEVRLGSRPDPEEGIRWEISIERAGRRFGYEPRCSLEDSIRAVASSPERRLARAIKRSPRREEFRK
jgi:nucleoside-diphosphate-sugar epimerase